MSLNKKDQVFPGRPKAISDAELAVIVSEALRRDFGDQSSAIKQIGKVTSASLRAIKNWYEARNTPSSGHLLLLARSSPSILQFVIGQVGGEDLLDAFQLLGQKPEDEPEPPSPPLTARIYSTENCTINITISPRIAQRLNQRQLWFLSQLQQNERVKADDIANQWGVSIMSAKSDIAGMKKMRLIRFEGSNKTGVYILGRMWEEG